MFANYVENTTFRQNFSLQSGKIKAQKRLKSLNLAKIKAQKPP
jgi:hypothetical protein